MIKKILKKYFGYDKFRPMQEEVIKSILNGKDGMVIMPTGGGKSLCYQIPAIAMNGIGVVISPLIALMKDQVEALQSNGINANYLNSTQTTQEQNEIIQELESNKIKLLYVSPEKLASREFNYLLSRLNINLFAIDEAHCISVWGHDFRPEYTKMRYIKKQYPNTPVIALTATADPLTQKDIMEQLNIEGAKMYQSSFNRSNLSLTVAPGQERFKSILNYIRQRPNQSGIIYCLSRNSTEKLAEKLRKIGINAGYYHAGLSTEERAARQDDFISDRVPIICATIAFGMGIDKSNVRWVIHYNLPKNIESYYQEIGRAGRDGLNSDTLLFYSYADVLVHKKFIEESSMKEILTAKLNRIQEYCQAKICRRKILLSYFGENLEEDCGNCDVCKNPPNVFDGTTIVQKALSAIIRLEQKVPARTVIDVLRGSNRYEILKNNYHKIKTYGVGKDISYNDWQQYITQMLHYGFISIAYDNGNALKITEKAMEVLKSSKEVDLISLHELTQSTAQNKAKDKLVLGGKEELFEQLRKLRSKIAYRRNTKPYMIFSDNSLKQMAEEEPTTQFEMLMISGVGEYKYEEFGEEFINCIIEFKQKAIKANQNTANSFKLSYEYYQQGFSLEQICKMRNMDQITIVSHLASMLEKGKQVDIYDFVDPLELSRIDNALKMNEGKADAKKIYIYMNEDIEFYKIRICISYLKTMQMQYC
jgi:ATP-dependent DNA helicase RecQ